MRLYLLLGSALLGSAVPLAAQTGCQARALTDAATGVAAVRRTLHTAAVPAGDPAVPPAVAAQLGQLKDHLTAAAQAVFACSPADLTAEQLQTRLADALHANRASASESYVETRDEKDVGAYGSDLGVQVFQLFGTPRFFEVDFRYGVECGDDNLLLVFRADDEHAPDGWHEVLRWDAPTYATVGDALGDFVLLTPLTGSYKTPTWRFVVAHGHPGCGAAPRASRFDLDLLTPTTDAAHPTVDWHFEQAYTQGNTVPRLATTEDTVEFRLALQASSEKADRKAAAGPPEVYRFHLTPAGHLEPSSATTDDGSAASPQAAAPLTPHSP